MNESFIYYGEWGYGIFRVDDDDKFSNKIKIEEGLPETKSAIIVKKLLICGGLSQIQVIDINNGFKYELINH